MAHHKILIDGRKLSAVDDDGHQLPTLVYLATEKRPQCPHNFKAGSMNALIRVSSEISNAPIILNLDCDMYSNDSDAIKEALCFFMDEKHGHKTSYVQHPQSYNNITKNDIYSNVASTTHLIELAGIDGYNAALYCGTGCFHRRESLCGLKYSENYIGRCVVCIERHSLVDGTDVWLSGGRHNNRINHPKVEDGNRILLSGDRERPFWGLLQQH
ncbi:Cellulose synthase-like protein E6 [Camellia lanceoleosa]|uniref:Cellulose synthase-like protein E6 n=1 Tax=Camellia lanceoleosa TaxID=1840588 RepID=A0ACC0I628_9ERIC|nr:Cellulose synthase-like protein E6 [Camellia lanceoleosa]